MKLELILPSLLLFPGLASAELLPSFDRQSAAFPQVKAPQPKPDLSSAAGLASEIGAEVDGADVPGLGMADARQGDRVTSVSKTERGVARRLSTGKTQFAQAPEVIVLSVGDKHYVVSPTGDIQGAVDLADPRKPRQIPFDEARPTVVGEFRYWQNWEKAGILEHMNDRLKVLGDGETSANFGAGPVNALRRIPGKNGAGDEFELTETSRDANVRSYVVRVDAKGKPVSGRYLDGPGEPLGQEKLAELSQGRLAWWSRHVQDELFTSRVR